MRDNNIIKKGVRGRGGGGGGEALNFATTFRKESVEEIEGGLHLSLVSRELGLQQTSGKGKKGPFFVCEKGEAKRGIRKKRRYLFGLGKLLGSFQICDENLVHQFHQLSKGPAPRL